MSAAPGGLESSFQNEALEKLRKRYSGDRILISSVRAPEYQAGLCLQDLRVTIDRLF